MTHKLTVPTEKELEDLITQVYEERPRPEQSRLLLIESNLLNKASKNKDQKNLNKIPWWIVLLVAGGFATAAWWAGEMVTDDQDTEIRTDSATGSDKLYERTESKQDINDESERYQQQDSPIIYQRESY